MIFGKNYDKTLKLLVDGDNKNRDKIIDFIRSIPNEFLERIQKTIVEYDNYKLNNKNNNKLFCGDCYGVDGNLYSFYIDKDADILLLSKLVCNFGLYFNDMSLVLGAYNDNITCDLKKYIGYLICDYNYVVGDKAVVLGDKTKIEYFLVNMPFNSYLLSYNPKCFLPLKVNPVNLNNLDDNYRVDTIDNPLVRRRSKK